jgi:hypothetical protein
VDLTAHVQNTVLDLLCEVMRDSFNVLLSVRIDVFETKENLLSFETSAPFCQPTAALHCLADSIPKAFAGQVVREYSYPLLPQGFLPHGGAVSLGGLIDYNVWSLVDLEQGQDARSAGRATPITVSSPAPIAIQGHAGTFSGVLSCGPELCPCK